METTLKPYTMYQETGLASVGPVPAHWSLRPLRSLTTLKNERGRPDLPLLSVYREYGVIRRDSRNDNHNPEGKDLTSYKIVERGDLVINKMKAWQGSLGVSKHDGIVSPAYIVSRLSGPRDPDYINLLLRSRPYVNLYDLASFGVRIGQWDLRYQDLKRIPLYLPPVEEQKAIARFLKHADAQSRKLIRAKQRLIALLCEQKQAIIQRAVTRGLDPDVPLKPSGVDWLGDVPAHWDVSRIKGQFENLNRRRIPLSTVERGRMKSRKYDYYGASGVIDQVDDYLFNDDLILIAEDGANLVLRNLPLAIIARGKFWVNNHAHILKPRRGNLQYWAYLLESLSYRPWITGAAQPKLTQDRLMAIPIPAPPDEEQDEIVAHVRDNTRQLDEAVRRSRSEIDLIREYRTRLIADVVTGKLDVRGVAVPEVEDDADEDLTVMEAEDELMPDEEVLAHADD